jgi:hypothetical protein
MKTEIMKMDMTTRERLRVCQALSYALVTIEGLPEQPWPMGCGKEEMVADIVALLNKVTKTQAPELAPEYFQTTARNHMTAKRA